MSLDQLTHIWPEKSGEYKVIQIDTKEEPFLRFGEFAEDNVGDIHSFIVKRFAKEIGVSCELLTDRGGYGAKVSFLSENHDELIVGMGRCYFDKERAIASFFGNSRHYVIGINLEHLKEMRGCTPNKLFVMVDNLLYKKTPKPSN